MYIMSSIEDLGLMWVEGTRARFLSSFPDKRGLYIYLLRMFLHVPLCHIVCTLALKGFGKRRTNTEWLHGPLAEEECQEPA